jgi:hypothetical protein
MIPLRLLRLSTDQTSQDEKNIQLTCCIGPSVHNLLRLGDIAFRRAIFSTEP